MPPEPNREQREVIEHGRGALVVDAGAGTGKTFAIARRYLHLLDAFDVEPRDVLLITFTNNAAAEMKERILHLSDLPPSRLRDAPISTFHALCKRVLDRHGFRAPRHLGLDESLPPTFRLVENEVLERRLFRRFLDAFHGDHPEHRGQLGLLLDPTSLLGLVRNLAAKGIVPTTDGWYRDGESHLDGDLDAYLELWRSANATDGSRQSQLRGSLSGFGKHLFLPDAPTEEEVRGPRGTKAIDDAWARRAFEADRTALKAFVHDLYLGYLRYALQRSFLNFSFLQVLAYVLLVEDDALRERLQHRFVMIDEFQDTSEIQFQLALLFSAESNLCAVGDWKQAIYGFQYASVENITAFQTRLKRYVDALNADRVRVHVDPGAVVQKSLVENYRSTQRILDLAPGSLTIPATKAETVDASAILDQVVELRSNARFQETTLGKLAAEDEVNAVLGLLQAIVGSDAYAVEEGLGDDAHLRAPTWGDVAVLTRTRSFALELQERARDLGIPVAFEGGRELFRTDAAKLLLAWLRLLEDRRDPRGWAVVLEQAGTPLDAAKHILQERAYPDDLVAFRDELARIPRVGALARRVFRRYGLHDGFTEAIVAELQKAETDTRLTRGDLVAFLAENHDAGTTYDVDHHAGDDVVTVQTIHGAKGLEYPIVILADVNTKRFPSHGGSFPDPIRYVEPVGLRQSKRRAHPKAHDLPPYDYDDWTWTLLNAALGNDYDEERRLLYVALTRARDHLLLTATAGRESPFWTEMDVPILDAPPEPQPMTPRRAEAEDPVPVKAPTEHLPRRLVVGDLVEEPRTHGRGYAFGTAVHDLAARYARGEDVALVNDDQRNVVHVVDQLRKLGTLRTEETIILPLEVDGRRFVLQGKIDLLVEGDHEVRVVDWKTVPPGEGEDAWRQQVGLYAWGVKRILPGYRVVGEIVYTTNGKRVEVEAMGDGEVASLVENVLEPV